MVLDPRTIDLIKKAFSRKVCRRCKKQAERLRVLDDRKRTTFYCLSCFEDVSMATKRKQEKEKLPPEHKVVKFQAKETYRCSDQDMINFLIYGSSEKYDNVI